MINQDPNPTPSSTITSIAMVPVGSIAQVLRSGDAYKAIGETVSRAAYPALSAAFPRNGSFSSVTSTPLTTNVWKSGAYGAGVFVVVGTATGGSATTSGMYSADGGKTWLLMTMPSGIWTDVVYGGGQFVAIASGGTVAATSADGITWIARTLPTSSTWIAVTYGASLYVAISSTGTVSASSPDGVSWTARTLPTSASWLDVTFGGGFFLAIASGSTAAATSTNGTSWTARTMPAVGALHVAFGANLFVVVGDSVFGCYTTTDGVTWTARVIPVSAGSTFYSITFGDGVFITIGNGGNYCAVSYDGIAWAVKTYAGPGTGILFSAFGAGAFLLGSSASGVSFGVAYAENLVDSDYLYLSGTAGQFIRVK